MATINGTFNSLIAGTLSGTVATPGAQGPAGPAGSQGIPGVPGAPGVGVPAGGLTNQFLVKTSNADFATGWTTFSLAGYATEAWVQSQGYITSSALTPYLSKAGNLDGLTNLALARDNLQLGELSNPTFAGVNVSGSGTNDANLGPTFLTLNQSGHGQFTIQPSQGIVFPDASIQTTAFPAGSSLPSGGTVGQVLTKNSGTNYDASFATLIPGDRYLTSSTTSLTIDNANKTLTVGTGLSYTPTQNITISYNASNHMHGEVLTYDSGTGVLTVDINNHTGSGTYAAWVVNVGGVTPATSVAWGAITGTLGSQTDLATALNSKLEVSTAASTYQTLSGMSSYLTTSAAAASYYPLTGNPSGFLTSAPVTSVAGRTGAITLSNTDISGLGTMSTVNDSPSDSQTYGRNNGAWVVAGGGGSFPADALTTNEVNAVADAEYVQFSVPATVAITYGSGVLSFYDSTIGADGKQITISGGSSFALSSGSSWGITLMTDTMDPGYPKYVEDLVGFINGQSVSLTATWTGTSGTDIVDGLTSYSPLELNMVPVGIQSGDRLMIEQGLRQYLTSSALSLSAAANSVLTYAGPNQGNIVAWAQPWQSEGYVTTSFVYGNFASLAFDNTLSGKQTLSAATTSAAKFNLPHGTAPTSPINGDIWTTTAGLFYQINGATVSPATLAGGTYTGLISTLAPTTATAGLRLPQGTAPTTPVDGDIWTTTGGLFVRIGGGTQQFAPLGSNNTFSNASSTYGSSTATGTIGLASGATISGSTKTLNIGTAGVSGSTTNITIGPVLGTSTISVGNTTAASTLNLATGATLTATTKAINIGTNGVSGSTTTITIGSTNGTTTTVNGLLSTTASAATAGAGLRIPHGTAPTTPVNGDVWTTTARLFARINGATQGMATQADIGTSGLTTFSSANIGTDTTASGNSKTVSVGTNGAAGSTTTVTIGSVNNTNLDLRGRVTFSAAGLATNNRAPINIGTGTPTDLTITSAGDIYYNASGFFGSLGGSPSVNVPLSSVRAFVNFSGTSTGTWAGGASTVTRTAGSTLAEVTTTNPHGLSGNNVVRALTGVVAGTYAISISGPNSFGITTVETTALSAVPITFAVNTIRASQNITSIADNGAGDYTVNFSATFPDVNYTALVGGCTTAGGGATNGLQAVEFITNSTTLARTNGAYRFYTLNSSGANTDALSINAVFLR